MAKVRLGFAETALARPLTWALLKGEHSDVFAASVLPHQRVAPLVAEGALDIGLVTQEECEKRSLVAVPDLGVVLVAGGGAARLECVVGRNQPTTQTDGQIFGGLDSDSECPGCAQVARSLLAGKRFANHRLLLSLDGDSGVQDEEVLGCAAESFDLAQRYLDVFAVEPVIYVWAHRSEFDSGAAEFALKSSLRFGLSGLSALSRELAAERGMSASVVEDVLRTGVRFVRPARSSSGAASRRRSVS